MSLLVKQAIAELRTAIMDAAGRAVADGEFPAVPLSDFNVEVPANRDFGDYSANAAMAWARGSALRPPQDSSGSHRQNGALRHLL